MNLPNKLSILRICLIPVFLIVYLTQNQQPYFIICALILILSGLTDVADGYIARKYHLVTELGRILDPLADKLTQVSICIALAVKHPSLTFLAVVFFCKEFLMLIGGFILIKKKKSVTSAKWFGKVGTMLFYCAMITIIAFPTLVTEQSAFYIVLCVVAYMLFSLLMYIPVFFKASHGADAPKNIAEPERVVDPELESSKNH